MSGRELYDKHSRALKAAERYAYRNNVFMRVFPDPLPPTWEFASNDLRRYYTELAKLVTPRKDRT